VRAVGRPTDNLAAYEHYLQGLAFWTRRNVAEDRTRAIAAYRAAVEEDPDFAAAWTALASSQISDFATYAVIESSAAAEISLGRVRALSPTAPETMQLEARWAYMVERDYERGRTLLDSV